MRRRAVVVVVTVVVGLVGVTIVAVALGGSRPSLDLPAPATVVEGPTCVADDAVEAARGVPLGEGDLPDGGTVPDGFTPVAVVWCDPEWPGGSDSLVIVESTLDGDLAALLDVLDGPFWSDPNSHMCDPAEWHGWVLWLLDDRGRAMRAGWPFDPCGGADHRVYQAVGELTVVHTREHRLDRDPRW
jgi:hypothetical protein